MKPITLVMIGGIFLSCTFTNAHSLAPEDKKISKEMVKASPLIVVGEVENINPAPLDREWVSEHNPDLQVADVSVTQTLKGDQRKKVLVVFAANKDSAWDKSPKLSVGQKSIFILNDFKPISPMRLRAGIYFYMLDELQVQPVNNLMEIEKLIK